MTTTRAARRAGTSTAARLAGSALALVVLVVLVVGAVSGCSGSSGGPVRGGSGSPRLGCPWDRDGGVPDRPLVGVGWRPLSGEVPILLPVSDRYGPCVVTATTATGYARTAGGAVVAAAQLVARAAVPGEVGRDTIRARVVPGPWRDALLDQVGDPEAGVGAPDVAWSAWSVAAWSPGAARVAVAATYRQVPGRHVVFVVDLVWRGGDWWLLPPPGGDWAHAVSSTVALPKTFVPWTGG